MVVPIFAIRKEQGSIKSTWEVGNQADFQHFSHGRVHKKGSRNVDDIKSGKQNCDLFPGPVFSLQHHKHHDDGYDYYCNSRRDSENRKGGGHTDKLGDQREPVDKGKINKGEPAPEGAKCIKDCFRMTAFGNRTQPHGHLLDNIGNRQEQQ
jgi:hypothetical protein